MAQRKKTAEPTVEEPIAVEPTVEEHQIEEIVMLGNPIPYQWNLVKKSWKTLVRFWDKQTICQNQNPNLNQSQQFLRTPYTMLIYVV